MPFQPGNRHWEARTKHGRDLIFADPDVMWAAAVEYFEWVEANPLYESKAFNVSGEIILQEIPKMRAMTLEGLCLFLGISQSCLSNYRGRDDFVGVISKIDDVIRDQKFSGAAADLLNANIIARDLGLRDSKELTGADGGPIKTESMTDSELAKRLAFLLAKGANND